MLSTKSSKISPTKSSIADNVAPKLKDFFKKKESLFSHKDLDHSQQTSVHSKKVIDGNDNDNADFQNEPSSTVATVSCGRIKFEGIEVKPDAPTDLICEECERQYCKFFCLECNQGKKKYPRIKRILLTLKVFCAKCANLCHPKSYGGSIMHPHETKGWIRYNIFFIYFNILYYKGQFKSETRVE